MNSYLHKSANSFFHFI